MINKKQQDVEHKKKIEQEKRLRRINKQRREYYESQRRRIDEYNRKKKETEFLLGMHLNQSDGFNAGRLYSPQSDNGIN